MVDLGVREKLVEPFHRGVQNVLAVLARNQESGAEVRDVGFDFWETPDITVVDKIVTLPESEIVRLGEDSLHLDVDSGAGETWLLNAVQTDLSSDVAFDTVCGDDHLGANFFCRFSGAFAEFHTHEACPVFDVTDKFCACAGDELGPVVFGEVGEPRVEFFAVEHDARAFLGEVDVHAVRAVNIKSVDNRLDAVLVYRAVSLQVRKFGACFAAAHGITDFFALFEEENFVACTGKVPGGDTSAGACANDDDIVFFVTEHRSTPGA